MVSEPRHPDPKALEAFALGRLDLVDLERVESHLVDCPSCVQAVIAVPMDHLVQLLRRPPSRSATVQDGERTMTQPTRGRLP